jgi:hypothetical protein
LGQSSSIGHATPFLASVQCLVMQSGRMRQKIWPRKLWHLPVQPQGALACGIRVIASER